MLEVRLVDFTNSWLVDLVADLIASFPGYIDVLLMFYKHFKFYFSFYSFRVLLIVLPCLAPVSVLNCLPESVRHIEVRTGVTNEKKNKKIKQCVNKKCFIRIIRIKWVLVPLAVMFIFIKLFY